MSIMDFLQLKTGVQKAKADPKTVTQFQADLITEMSEAMGMENYLPDPRIEQEEGEQSPK